jgi:Cu(I)/Ag(I) efflux system membrane fusion protein
VEVRVVMPAMGAMPAMGGPAAVREEGGGAYRADFALSMPGQWSVELRATAPGGAVATASGSLAVGAPGLRFGSAGGGQPAGAGHEHAQGGPTHAGAGQAAGESPGEFQFSPERLQTIGVRSEPAAEKDLVREIRALGRVIVDETALVDVSLKVRGWIGDLRVDAVGDRVRRGDVLFTFYAPELFAAQQELLQALRSQARAHETHEPGRADTLVRAARNRMRLWDVAPEEIAAVEARGEPLEYLPIRAPATGFVIEKNAVAGGTLAPGQRAYRIAPLDRVWIEAQVYESELALVREGETAEIELPHLPGRRFEARVAYVYPTLDAGTRTARVRLELPNPELELRPDMWANVALRVELGRRLAVPSSAVLYAGERSFVFLDLGGGRLRPRRVETGVRAGDDVEIRAGLEPGERIVVSGTFLVASESRLRAALEQW